MNKNIWFCRAYRVMSFKKVYKKYVFGLMDELQKRRGLLKMLLGISSKNLFNLSEFVSPND